MRPSEVASPGLFLVNQHEMCRTVALFQKSANVDSRTPAEVSPRTWHWSLGDMFFSTVDKSRCYGCCRSGGQLSLLSLWGEGCVGIIQRGSRQRSIPEGGPD